MFFSLLQTLVCVLLINGGLYALHLTGNGNSGASSGGVAAPSSQIGPSSQSANDMINILTGGGQHHAQHSGGGGGGARGSLKKQKPLDSSGRLTEELADMAQLERERLMLLGLAKQTAATSTGHHGRPIITGRIQMTPAEDIEGDYPALLMQQARGFMFGNVVKQPAETDDYEAAEEYDGGGLSDRRRPVKYEYGRVVQPSDREYEPQHMDVDGFLELESEPDVDDMLPDLDGYQYLDEILAERHRGWGDDQAASNFGSHHGYHAGHAQNAFHALEELEAQPQQTLQELLDKERHEAAAKLHQEQEQQKTISAAKHRNGAYNTHLQQKWQRKRAQQQQQQQQLKQWQRNIFGQQKQPHYYSAQHTKLSMANSEATATKHIDKPSLSSSAAPSAAAAAAAMQSSSSLLSAPALSAGALNAQNGRSAQQSDRQQAQAADTADGASAGAEEKATAAKTAAKLNVQQQQQQQKPEKFLHPNRKRSGGVSAAATGGYSAGMQSPVTHSIASQLMLRTARGQRQYDVPQIECPTAMDGMERFACPTPDLQGRYRCIDDHVLCDGFIDCPEGEDEDRRSCMFYKTTKAHLDVLADALLRWARGR